jgi:hypothetical protein
MPLVLESWKVFSIDRSKFAFVDGRSKRVLFLVVHSYITFVLCWLRNVIPNIKTYPGCGRVQTRRSWTTIIVVFNGEMTDMTAHQEFRIFFKFLPSEIK